MTKSGLPIAKELKMSYKIGNISIKTEKPTKTKADVEKTIDVLKNTANKGIFVQNDRNFI